jgi:hypothetical protein
VAKRNKLHFRHKIPRQKEVCEFHVHTSFCFAMGGGQYSFGPGGDTTCNRETKSCMNKPCGDNGSLVCVGGGGGGPRTAP